MPFNKVYSQSEGPLWSHIIFYYTAAKHLTLKLIDRKKDIILMTLNIELFWAIFQ